ncbi:ArsR/SmtB family transcription factor [Streptomyces roseolilacinus]|uniref:Transcriptional regulator n=1 Tax=Streptomyces roseolilacinus TaxID=66904 RepID=A0A918EKX3_9ACTN|nr:helix-turn-helix domain-containing protein [Streptomyces roseolilacinus]GGQ01489.1 transcriptional regulator [Streptomyces roseolilacinus]
MLRIHFTGADLGRLRLAARPDVMWETALSLHQLARPDAFFGPWHRVARRTLAQANMGRAVHLLTALVPISSYFPDFLTPPGHVTCLEEGVDGVLSTGRNRLRAEIARLADPRPHPSAWLDDVAAGRPHALRRLGAALLRYHFLALAPYAPAGAALAQRHATRHARVITEQGSEALLGGLGPQLRWRPPALEVDYPVSKSLELGGRGLLLVPSFFCHNHPIALADPALPPTLVFPVARGPLWIPQPEPCAAESSHARGLDELVGPTRAATLRLLDTAHSTTELAARLCTSASTASRHATALRRAGLVVTERTGTSVTHTRTALGTGLVHGT